MGEVFFILKMRTSHYFYITSFKLLDFSFQFVDFLRLPSEEVDRVEPQMAHCSADMKGFLFQISDIIQKICRKLLFFNKSE